MLEKIEMIAHLKESYYFWKQIKRLFKVTVFLLLYDDSKLKFFSLFVVKETLKCQLSRHFNQLIGLRLTSGDKLCKLSMNRKYSQETTGPFVVSIIKMSFILFLATKANGYGQNRHWHDYSL